MITNGSHDVSNNYDRLKQEILVEIRKEMQQMKNEIINGKKRIFRFKFFFFLLNFSVYF